MPQFDAVNRQADEPTARPALAPGHHAPPRFLYSQDAAAPKTLDSHHHQFKNTAQIRISRPTHPLDAYQCCGSIIAKVWLRASIRSGFTL